MTISIIMLAIVASYFIGAVPFGLFFSRIFSHVDVRTVGSGNIGATNVLRAAGKKAAALTLLADALKGFLPVLIVNVLFHNDSITVLCGAAAILGHNFPVYLAFKGGKGVATSFGVILAFAPATGLACLVIWLLTALIWRYSSLSALIAFAAYPLIIILVMRPTSQAAGTFSLFVFALVYYRHRENIKRLLAGMEPKIGKK